MSCWLNTMVSVESDSVILLIRISWYFRHLKLLCEKTQNRGRMYISLLCVRMCTHWPNIHWTVPVFSLLWFWQ